MAGSPSGGVEIGAGYVSIYPDTSSFHGAIVDAIDGAGEKSAKSFFSPWQIAVGNLLSDITRSLVGSINERVTNAIGRLDTLTNYPKVMEGFGYTAEEAEESIELIMDRLVGLPTRTQDMVQFTQSLADSTGDLDLATRSALAFNDALLASGASVTDQTRATRMWNRIVGSGTATVNQWSALMAVMPLQLGMTSRALLGAGASTEDLGNALRDGKVSIEDILRTMVQLDEQGFEGMDSFNEQAWNMAFTLETALKLIPMRIENALAAIMQEIGRDNIMAPFLAIANGIKAGGDLIISGIQWVKNMFADDLHEIYLNLKSIGDSMSEFFGVLGGTIMSAIKAAVPVLLSFLEGLTGVIAGVFQWIADNGEVVQAILVGIVSAFVAFNTLNGLPAMFLKAASSAGGLFRVLAANPLVAVISLIAGLAAAFATWVATTEEGRAVWAQFEPVVMDVLGKVQRGFMEFASTIMEVVGTIVSGIMGVVDSLAPIVSTMVSGFIGAVNDIIPVVQTIIAGFFGAVGDIAGLVGTIVSGFVEFITPILELLGTTVRGFAEFIGGAVEMIVAFIVGAADAVDSFLRKFKSLYDGAKEAITKLKNTVKKILDSIVKFFTGGAKDIFNGFLAPITSMKNKFGDLVNGMKNIASTAWNGIKSLASSIFNGIKSVIGNAVDGAKNLASTAWNGMKSLASTAWNGMKSAASSVFGGIKDIIGGAFDGAKSLARKALDGIQGFINSLTGRTVNVKVNDGTPGGTASLIRKVQGQIDGLHGRTVTVNVAAQGVTRIVASAQGVVASFKAQYGYLATGGIVTAPTLAMIGEAGTPEGVIPLSPSGMKPIAQAVVAELDGQSKGGVLVTGNNFYVRDESDISRVANELNFLISRQNGGRL